jgi:hypothetical protein
MSNINTTKCDSNYSNGLQNQVTWMGHSSWKGKEKKRKKEKEKKDPLLQH